MVARIGPMQKASIQRLCVRAFLPTVTIEKSPRHLKIICMKKKKESDSALFRFGGAAGIWNIEVLCTYHIFVVSQVVGCEYGSKKPQHTLTQ